MHVYRVTEKGQVTLPKNIRDFLQVREGDYITYIIENGKVIVTKALLTPFDKKKSRDDFSGK